MGEILALALAYPWNFVLYAVTELVVDIMVPSAVKDAKAFSKEAFASNLVTNAEEVRVAKLQNIIGIAVSTAGCKNVWQWA